MVYGNSVCGEKLSGDVQSVLDFKEMFLNLNEYEGLSVDAIYDCDETGFKFLTFTC